MHELSIALNIIEVAQEEAAQHKAERVRSIHVRIGALAGVAREPLVFCYGLASVGTPMEGSALVFEEAEGTQLEIVGLEVE